MFNRKLGLALALCLFAVPAWAQNTQCSNRPAGDSTNACANTRFVQAAIAAIPPPTTSLTVGTTAITGGTNTRVLFDNSGVLGEYSISGTGSVAMTASPTFTGTLTAAAVNSTSLTTGGTLITSASSGSLIVGPNGVTNPTFNVDDSTASAATGFNIKSAAAAGGLALSVISSGSNENLTLNAKGSGSVTIGNTSTGPIILNGAVGAGTDTAPLSAFYALSVSKNVTTGIGLGPGPLIVNAADGINSTISLGSWGTGVNPYFLAYAARGTAASPTQLLANDVVAVFGGKAMQSGGGHGVIQGIKLVAAENQTGTAEGMFLDVLLAPTGTIIPATVARFQSSGGVSINTTSDPGAGMIYTNAATFMIRTKTSYTNGAAAGAGTITTAPTAGNPTKWIPVDDNGTTRYIPAW